MQRISSFAFAFSAVSAALILTGCETKHTATHDPRIETPLVRIASAQRESAAGRSFTGVVVARVQSDLGFRVPGKIVQRLVDVGQTVKRGQILMRIDSAELELTVAARAADVESAKARSIQASADEARLRSLVKSGVVSAQSYDLAKASADSAVAQLTAAEAQVRVAQNYSQYSVLVADADGTVVSILTEPGQVVQAGQVVIRLAQAGPREASVNLPESLRPQIGSSAETSLYGAANESSPSSATLRQLSDSADPVTRTFEARYVLEGDMADAPLGSTVTVRLGSAALSGKSPSTRPVSSPEHAVTPLFQRISDKNGPASKESESSEESATAASPVEVPLAAVHDAGNGPGVWVLDAQTSTVSFRRVRIGRLGEDTAVLVQGLAPGERVVSLGAHLLREGQHVRTAEKQEIALR
ncbi:MAG: efflux RND transporter periplasmic adaptor subunit [Candidatus Methylacidiphilales bacterium]